MIRRPVFAVALVLALLNPSPAQNSRPEMLRFLEGMRSITQKTK